MADDPLERSLSELEERLVFQVADAVESAIGSRDPAMLIEVAAHLLASVMFDHTISVKGDLAACEAMAFDLTARTLERVTDIGMRANEAMIATAVPAGHA